MRPRWICATHRKRRLVDHCQKIVKSALDNAEQTGRRFSKSWSRVPLSTPAIAEVWNSLALKAARVGLYEAKVLAGHVEVQRVARDAVGSLDPELRPFFHQALLLYAFNEQLSRELGKLVIRHRRHTELRRALLRESMLLRLLPEKADRDERGWGELLAERFLEPLPGQHESMADRMAIFAEDVLSASGSAEDPLPSRLKTRYCQKHHMMDGRLSSPINRVALHEGCASWLLPALVIYAWQVLGAVGLVRRSLRAASPPGIRPAPMDYSELLRRRFDSSSPPSATNPSVRTHLSPGSAKRMHQFTRDTWWSSPPLHPGFRFSVHTGTCRSTAIEFYD